MLFDRNAGRVAAINIVALLFHVGIHAASDELPKVATQFFSCTPLTFTQLRQRVAQKFAEHRPSYEFERLFEKVP
jgi:hypothetical protein